LIDHRFEVRERRGALPPSFLRDRRAQHRLSPDDLAARVGVHPASVLRWERGERLPGPSHVTALAHALALETAEVAAFFDTFRQPAKSDVGVRGHGLRLLRTLARIPAVRVAETVGVPPATVYNWEAGRARLPVEHLPALADTFRLEVEALHDLLRRAPAAQTPESRSPLRRMRHRSGLPQAAVADRIGVSRHLVGSWERGVRPPLFAVRRLASVYGLPVSVVARAAGVSPPTLLDPHRWTAGDLPAVLRVLRQWTGMTQVEVAERCGCSVAAVRAWERGRCVPRPVTMRRLEDIFGLARDALLGAVPQADVRKRHSSAAR
jgi:transcriptional regulator with XRE-family HTH domain